MKIYGTETKDDQGNVIKDGEGNSVYSLNVRGTLILPYGAASNATGRNQSGVATLEQANELYYVLANTLPETYKKSWVKVGEGVTLTVSGTLEISGELTGGSGGHMSGHTAGKYATLELMSGAKIEVYGTVKSFGFIENVEGNDNGKLTVYDGATLYQPFTLIDYKGGTIMSGLQAGMQEHKYAPFHQFNFPNVSVDIRYNYGGQMMAWCNLSTNLGVSNTVGTMIGKSTSSFIQLTDAKYSYLECKYDPETQITDLRFFGGATMNDMSLTVKAFGITINVKSSDFIFGLSWLFNITLDNTVLEYVENNVVKQDVQSLANYRMPFGYKMLPGSNLTIEKGAKLTIGKLAVYSAAKFDDRLGGKYPNTGIYPEAYPTTSSLSGIALPDARLLVRGALVATDLAGDVYTDVADATVKASRSIAFGVDEPTVVNSSFITGSVDDYQTIDLSLALIYINGASDGNLPNSSVPNGDKMYPGMEYYSSDDSNGKRWNVPDYFEILVGDGFNVSTNNAITVIDGVISRDASGNVIFHSYNSATDTSTEKVVYLLTDGTASVIYTLQSGYVLLDDSGKAQTSANGVGGTFNGIRSPKVVCRIPTSISINNNAKTTNSYYYVDDNGDGICEIVLSAETKGSCKGLLFWYTHKLPSKFKVNINGETVTVENEDGTTTDIPVYEECAVGDTCTNHDEGENVITYVYEKTIYAVEDENGNYSISVTIDPMS